MRFRRMMLRREYHGYTGGHGKFLDYIDHVASHPDWEVSIHMDEASINVAGNPFTQLCGPTQPWHPESADALLVGGMDWMAVPEHLEDQVPIINLIQHVRHADPELPLRHFLHRRATRICVSQAVADAILSTGEVCGPVRVIPAAVDLRLLNDIARSKKGGIFIDAVKHPELGQAVASRLHSVGLQGNFYLHCERVSRLNYLEKMAQASVVIALPDPTEGFYLPGLEALAMGCALVQPDCLGSRQYAFPEQNMLEARRDADDLARLACDLLVNTPLRNQLVDAGRQTARDFDLPGERNCIHKLLDTLTK